MIDNVIYEGKKLILEFLGIGPKKIGNDYTWNDSVFFRISSKDYEYVIREIIDYSKFDTSIEWAFKFLDKLAELKYKFEIGTTLSSELKHDYYCEIWSISTGYGDTFPEAIFKAAVKFIKWYNKEQK